MVVAVETVSRKLFNVSLQGADELGGYALAVGSTIAFSLALMGRNHIRVDVFHDEVPARAAGRAELVVDRLAGRLLRLFIAWVAFKVIGDTRQYGSTAQTPWATPLIWPQSVVVRGPGDLRAGGGRLRGARHAAAADAAASTTLNHDFHPKSAKEELKEETRETSARTPGTAQPRSTSMSVRCSLHRISFAMIGMMLIGLPIAVSMALVGIVGGIAAYGVPFMDSIAPVVWGVQNENLLTSIPLFVLLGELLLRSGIADRMYIALSAWLGPAARRAAAHQHRQLRAVRGDLGLVGGHRGDRRHRGAALAAKRGYSMRASLGSLAAGGTLGILIPPSVNMIVYGSLTNTSIGKLFIAGIIPGLLLTGCFMLWIWISQRGERQRQCARTRCRWPSACAR